MVCKTIEYDDAVMFEASDLILCFTLFYSDIMIKRILIFEIGKMLVDFFRLLVDLCQLFFWGFVIKNNFLIPTSIIIVCCVILLLIFLFSMWERASKPIFLFHGFKAIYSESFWAIKSNERYLRLIINMKLSYLLKGLLFALLVA